jgi:hypothetical protein
MLQHHADDIGCRRDQQPVVLVPGTAARHAPDREAGLIAEPGLAGDGKDRALAGRGDRVGVLVARLQQRGRLRQQIVRPMAGFVRQQRGRIIRPRDHGAALGPERVHQAVECRAHHARRQHLMPDPPEYMVQHLTPSQCGSDGLALAVELGHIDA